LRNERQTGFLASFSKDANRFMPDEQSQGPIGEELGVTDLAAHVRSGDSVALQKVVKAYLQQIIRAARGTGLRPQEAEDVAQATFMTFLETRERFEGRSTVRTWLFGILYRKVAEARRGFQRTERSDSIEDVMESRFRADGSWSTSPRPLDDQVFDSEVREHLERCLEETPTSQRMAFVLREVEGFSTGEICKILDVTATNLGVLLYRVRNRLRECLEARGIRR
jgi:RNA polymerase sigma-70 factor (ECF subfamily)